MMTVTDHLGRRGGCNLQNPPPPNPPIQLDRDSQALILIYNWVSPLHN